MVGHIPKTIKYVWGSEKKLESYWDDSELDIPDEQKRVVVPAFPCDADNPKTIETAKSWANGRHWQDKKVKMGQLDFPNEPMNNIQLISLEHRGEGGRAYKVIARRGDIDFFFDLREDVLLDALLNCKTNKGYFLTHFVWARVGSQMKIVRVGSELHNKLLKATSRKGLKKIKDLEVGGVYVGKNETEYIYLGKFDYVDGLGKLNKNVMLFEKKEDSGYGYRWFEYKKSHVMIEKVKSVKVPNDIVKNIKDYAVARLKEYQKVKRNENILKIHPWFCEQSYGEYAFIAEHGKPIVPPVEYEKYYEYLKSKGE